MIDDKLRAKLKALVFDEWDYEDFLAEGLEFYVKAIKQVFADEPIIKLALAYKQAGGDTSDVFIISRRDAKRNMQGYMTGQEWYDRFEKEMLDVMSPGADPPLNIMNAAKRASGL